jgi:hypothetical protein
VSGRWSPGIGDPSLGGWLTVLAYFVAALLCFRVFLKPRCYAGTTVILRDRERWCWLALSALMIFLCINKQLDLQSLFTQIGRDIAKSEGWYANRRAVQLRFILIFVAASALAGGAVMMIAARARNHWVRLAALGTILILIFIVVRAASFHHFETILDARMMGLRYNWIFEVTPVALIGWAAAKSARWR